MKTTDRCDNGQQPLEVELLLKGSQRAANTDDLLDEILQVDPFNGDPPSKRKDSELARTLAILDELENERGLK